MSSRTAVVTIVHRRHDHLEGLLWGLARQTLGADVLVVVAMEDPDIPGVVGRCCPAAQTILLPAIASTSAGLPLAAARNLGARVAIDEGADQLVFLDVDCIPSPVLLEAYSRVLGSWHGADGPVVACGEVGYLPPVSHPRDYRTQELDAMADPHPVRPRLAPGDIVVADDLRLFWSLSFATTSAHWVALGGFSESFVGYGGEDTDFGQRIGLAGGTMLWVGGAAAYHQHHASDNPPVQHLHSIVANANLFRRTWGWFPMEGWLARFAEMGLAGVDSRSGEWHVLPARAGAAMPPDMSGGASIAG
jgi:hypothetical protein